MSDILSPSSSDSLDWKGKVHSDRLVVLGDEFEERLPYFPEPDDNDFLSLTHGLVLLPEASA